MLVESVSLVKLFKIKIEHIFHSANLHYPRIFETIKFSQCVAENLKFSWVTLFTKYSLINESSEGLEMSIKFHFVIIITRHYYAINYHVVCT